MKLIIGHLGDTISQSQGTSSVMHTQSSGFGMGTNSLMNHTINTNRDSELLQSTGQLTRRTAKQFFSKENENHPSIEENHKLR